MLGKEVEGYRITNLIGKGGMGVVYQAVHEGIGQRAAVKILFSEFSTDVDAVSRFVAEARAASRVRHGGLVKIFYSGRLEDGTAYIMMEFLDGETIEERRRRLAKEGRRMELGTILRIGQQIASALSAVHREGIVHRDLKPANIILVADPEITGGERIKVVDFGIAKFDRAATEISKTTVGRFLGTALYASPEQCQMAGEVGPLADVYSLGIMLYELVAGRPPFEADQPGTIIGMHLFMQPTPLWEVAPEVPEPLHRLIHQMLAKAPGKRPSMDEVYSRLSSIKTERPGLLWRLRRDRRVLVAAAGVVVLSSAGTLWRLSQRGRTAAVTAPPTRTLPEGTPTTLPPAPSAASAGPLVRLPADMAAPEPAQDSVAGRTPEPKQEPEVARLHGEKGSVRSGRPRRRAGKPVAAPAEKATGMRTPAEISPPTLSVPPMTTTPAQQPAARAPEPKPPENRDAKQDKNDDGIIR